MEKELRVLYNTLLTIETKGESTKIMGECLKYTEGLIKKAHDDAEAVAVSTEE